MLNYTTGDLLKSDAEALVNTVNCEGFMGKGIAYQFKLQYPQNNEDYVRACRSGALAIGKLHYYKEKGKIIINFPTKDKWREKSRMEYIEKGLDELVVLARDLGLTSIAIPPLGSGNGGLDLSGMMGVIVNDQHPAPAAQQFVAAAGAGEAGQARRALVKAEAQFPADGNGGQGIDDIVLAGHMQVAGGRNVTVSRVRALRCLTGIMVEGGQGACNGAGSVPPVTVTIRAVPLAHPWLLFVSVSAAADPVTVFFVPYVRTDFNVGSAQRRLKSRLTASIFDVPCRSITAL